MGQGTQDGGSCVLKPFVVRLCMPWIKSLEVQPCQPVRYIRHSGSVTKQRGKPIRLGIIVDCWNRTSTIRSCARNPARRTIPTHEPTAGEAVIWLYAVIVYFH